MDTEQRLDQAERFLETIARYIDRHERMFEQSQAEMVQLRTHMDEALGIFTDLAQFQRESQARMEARMEQIEQRMEQHELRMEQNQAEIRRIWEYLLNQYRNGHSDES